MNSTKVVIVMAKCARTAQSYGIRFEQTQSGLWQGDWAFAIKETVAQREGYDRSEIAGSFEFSSAYPGCPACENSTIFKCGCGTIACWDGVTKKVTCPSCKHKSQIQGTIERLQAGGDR